MLSGPAGTVVMIHRHLHHRALPSPPCTGSPQSTDPTAKRRMLILQFGGVELRELPYHLDIWILGHLDTWTP